MSAASIQSSSASRLMNGVAKNNQQYFAYLLLCTSTQSTNCDIEIFQSKFDGAFVRAALTRLWRAAFSNKGKFSEFRARRWLDTWRNVSVIIAAVELLRFRLFFFFSIYGLQIYRNRLASMHSAHWSIRSFEVWHSGQPPFLIRRAWNVGPVSFDESLEL
jgi:hypothetical protein